MRIAFLGDIALVGQFDGSEGEKNISTLIELLKGYDYIVANLESPLTNKRTTIIPKSMHLRANESSVATLIKLGVDAVTLANNHTYDYGRKGLEDTIRVLEKSGIEWYGVDGKSLTKIMDGEKLSFSGFCCYSTNGIGYTNSGKGINTLTIEAAERQIKNDKQNGFVSIISAHYGIEHTNFPAIEHINLFNRLSEENVVIVHGHHPHQIQGITKKNGSLIAYSLGNALFDKTSSINGSFTVEMNEENRRSFVLGVEIKGGKIVSYETKGFYISENGIVPLQIDDKIIEISELLMDINDVSLYKAKRKEQYQSVLNKKFGKHDWNWFKSRLNYYSINAKILSVSNKRKYLQIFEELME